MLFHWNSLFNVEETCEKSSQWRCSVERDVLKNFTLLTVLEPLLIKLQAFRPRTATSRVNQKLNLSPRLEGASTAW